MKTRTILGQGQSLLVVLFGLSGAMSPAVAQNTRDVRIQLNPIRSQVGIVTRVIGNAAWIKMPNLVRVGEQVDFTPFSDGEDTVARGSVAWVSPVAPYEVYVTGVKTTTTRHDINENDDLYVTAAILKTKKEVGTRPETDGFGNALSPGFFVRARVQAPTEQEDVIEPVRAYAASLRQRNTRIAGIVASLCEKALKKSENDSDVPGAFGVDYLKLEKGLRILKELTIKDTVVEKVVRRLELLVKDRGNQGTPVPTDFLRTTPLLQGLGAGGLGTRPQ